MRRIIVPVAVLAVTACTPTASDPFDATTSPVPSTTTTTSPASTTTAAASTTTAPLPTGVIPPPEWLGTRPLPVGEDGFGEVLPTPPELEDRRIATSDTLTPPADGGFRWSASPVPAEVADRSTWTEECPASLDQLTYVTVSFHGFDGRFHTGELLVATEWADDIASVFQSLHEARFPIEEMRIATQADLEAPPTGDGNNTTAFVCRPVVGSTGWSEHAYGRAIDINPFHNPYVRGELVLPELAGAYADRTRRLPGMIEPDGPVVAAFAAIGWGWGGAWDSLRDYQHFSASGR